MNIFSRKFGSLSISAIEGFVPLALSFITLPFLFKKLGPEDFGYFSIFLSFAGFAPLLNFGLPQSFYRFVSERRVAGTDPWVKFISMVALLFSVLFFVSLIVFFISLFLVPYFIKFNNVSFDIYWLSIYLALIFFFQEVGSAFSYGIRAVERFLTNIIIECVCRVFYLIGIFFITKFEDVIALHCALLFLTSILKFISLSNFIGGAKIIGFAELIEGIELRSSLSFGGWSWLQALSGVLLSVFDRILVAKFFGVYSVGFYSAFLSFAQLFHLVLAGLFQPFYGRILVAKDVRSEVKKLMALGVKILYGYVLTCLIFVFFFGDYFMSLWLGADALIFIDTFYILSFSYIALSLSVLPHFLLMGILDYKYISIAGLMAGILSIASSFILSDFGLNSFAAGKLLFAFALLAHFPRLKFLINAKK